jgi:hypothetical protein
MNNKEVGCKDGRKMEPVQNHLGITSVEPPGSAAREFVKSQTKLLTTATNICNWKNPQ